MASLQTPGLLIHSSTDYINCSIIKPKLVCYMHLHELFAMNKIKCMSLAIIQATPFGQWGLLDLSEGKAISRSHTWPAAEPGLDSSPWPQSLAHNTRLIRTMCDAAPKRILSLLTEKFFQSLAVTFLAWSDLEALCSAPAHNGTHPQAHSSPVSLQPPEPRCCLMVALGQWSHTVLWPQRVLSMCTTGSKSLCKPSLTTEDSPLGTRFQGLWWF